ncbi:MAG: GGDEF domain-containing protein, partial [Clostridia bacterium]|nr:GGDEF domain-containing protein [Clostridia bacterium]
IVLTLREEFVCLVFLFCLICYYSFYKTRDENHSGMPFLKISLYAFGHEIFDVITVITVNHLDTVPGWLNKALHIIFYGFALLFIIEFLDYVISLTRPYRLLRIYRRVKYIPVAILILLSFVLPIDYVEGRGTNYSYGPIVFCCYGTVALYCIAATLLVVANRKHLDKKMRLALLPTITLMMIMGFIQAVIPEVLMTGACATFVCLGLFATIDNPVSEYIEQAFWDHATGVRNKNSFEKQMSALEKKYHRKQLNIGFVVCDINGLKLTNDRYGHAEGDRLIKAAAGILLAHLKSAYNVYRVGGDEFAAIYLSPNDASVDRELEHVRAACRGYDKSPVELSIAMGYASGTGVSVEFAGILNRADANMYENKDLMKKLDPELCR